MTLDTVDDVIGWLQKVVEPTLGPTYSPDKPGVEYRNHARQRILSDDEAEQLDRYTERAKWICSNAGVEFSVLAYGVLNIA